MSIECGGRSSESPLRRPSGHLRLGGTESLQRGAAAFVGHRRSGSPVSSTYSRVCTDRVYHFCVQKPVQAHEAAFPRSNRLLRARAGVSRVPVLSRDFREPVPPVNPTSLISQGSRRVERQFVPVVPVSADLYARMRACAHTHTHTHTHTHRVPSKKRYSWYRACFPLIRSGFRPSCVGYAKWNTASPGPVRRPGLAA